MAWDAAQGRCVEAVALDAGTPMRLRPYQEELPPSGYREVDAYLDAVRGMTAPSEVAHFNALITNDDYRARFVEAYPDGRIDGFWAAVDEIGTEIEGVLQGLYAASEAIAADPALGGELLGAAGLWLTPALSMTPAEKQRLDAKLANLQDRLRAGRPATANVESLPFEGLRATTRGIMQAVSSLQVWKNAVQGPSKLTVAMAGLDALLQSKQDWSDVMVGAEQDLESLFSVTTGGLVQLNCDPAAQGYNLGWIAGYSALWAATIIVFEAAIALESPL